ncbi:MAG TPA: NAD(P)-dependent glycerol-3-phosphate dehydrogenase [Candidatus Gemmiger stercoravium]|uniref:NAD(P)H-dependent glycerol-3-phosphate dehydrogenase n=1 Tax=uncultured Subdoligranulum sp. TaxID=512298 RepID=UPI001F9A1D2E|nr:NAD(P)H-dependent glycerol-3-phosphate dehydrogenase [uncultured Subdoligranulum sp.]HJC55425.1 NAD(P)-dependent glycerol-3-phosphate dehydrogenase [Candidatus Gemmiger stercoravium]
MTKQKIGVLGAGTWGTALARLLAENGHDVTIWSALPEELKSMATTHRHPNLPGMQLPAALHYTADMADICAGRDLLVFAVPSVFVRSTAKKAARYLPDGQLIVDVAKGIEEKTLFTLSEVIESELHARPGHEGCRVVALSGPTHAEEVARDLPTLIVAAAREEADAQKVQHIFTNPNFRVYTNTDRRGVELGGAVKNVIALAVGVALGLDYGDNAKAALITRGNAELARLGVAMGCQAATFAGLSGMGDLIVTCTSMHSRNLHAGMLIGRGMDVETAKKEVGQVVEGINALPAARRLAKKYKVEMPIVEAMGAILDGRLSARSAVATLMGRDLKRE